MSLKHNLVGIWYLGFTYCLVLDMLKMTHDLCRNDILTEDWSVFEKFLGRRKDNSDTEFWNHLDFHFMFYLPFNAFYYAFRRFHVLQPGWMTSVYTLFCLCILFGLIGCVLIFVLVIVVCVPLHNKVLLWPIVILYYIGTNSYDFQFFVFKSFPHPHQFITAIAWIPLKVVSSIIDQKSEQNHGRKFTATFHYVFIPFNFVYGPFIPFDIYSHNKVNQNTKLVIMGLLRHTGILTLLAIGKHFLHFNALIDNEFFQHKVHGYERMVCIFFCATFYSSRLKSIYGSAIIFSEDSIAALARLPVCIGYAFDYRHIWRNFDVTMNLFLRRYVHEEISQFLSERGWYERYETYIKTTLLPMVCFLLIGFFHGFSRTIQAWCVINFWILLLRKVLDGFCKAYPIYGHALVQIPLTMMFFTSSVLFFYNVCRPLHVVAVCFLDVKVWLSIGGMIICKKILTRDCLNDF